MERADPAPTCAAFLIQMEVVSVEAARRSKRSLPHTKPLAQGPRGGKRSPHNYRL